MIWQPACPECMSQILDYGLLVADFWSDSVDTGYVLLDINELTTDLGTHWDILG